METSFPFAQSLTCLHTVCIQQPQKLCQQIQGLPCNCNVLDQGFWSYWDLSRVWDPDQQLFYCDGSRYM